MLFRERRTKQLEPRRFRDDLVLFTTRVVGGAWHTSVASGAELAV
jgi:hypothetical protein